MQCEYFALEGLSDLVNTIKKVKNHLNTEIEIEGLLRTLFDKRNTLAQQVSEQLSAHFGSKVYETIIPRNVRLAEAPSYGKPVLFYDKNSKGAVAYLALADEILGKYNNEKYTKHNDSYCNFCCYDIKCIRWFIWFRSNRIYGGNSS
jgi:chromosome partitioning protein